MKVLLIHNYYQSASPSGEDAVFSNEAVLLRKREIEVITYTQHNDDLLTDNGSLGRALNAVWSRKTYHEVSALIKRERPDIAHFHNIWYLVSPSAYYACKDAAVPVVQTLHNFRMFCVNGLLLRDGRVCEDCIGTVPWRGMLYSCFRNSRLLSVPVAAAELIHKAKNTWHEQIDAYIALTGFGKKKFIECGLPAEKIFVKPNFLPDPPSPVTESSGYAVYAGRLSEEKGLGVLMDAFEHLTSSHLTTPFFSLKIIGDGPLKDMVSGTCETLNRGQNRDEKTATIKFLNRKSHAECMDILSKAGFLILPSVCYENFPLSVVEAFACGKPVVASRLGALAEIVQDKKTGLLFEPGNHADFAEKIRWMVDHVDARTEMGRNARAEFESKYTAEHNFETLMNIYEQVLT